jgi:hypothetical protein
MKDAIVIIPKKDIKYEKQIIKDYTFPFLTALFIGILMIVANILIVIFIIRSGSSGLFAGMFITIFTLIVDYFIKEDGTFEPFEYETIVIRYNGKLYKMTTKMKGGC